jgi:phosphate transport system substrate-binding protein
MPPLAAAVLLTGGLFSSPLRAADTGLQPYEPHAVEVPKNASYLKPDGSISIIGDDGAEEEVAKLNALFTKTHPGIHFTVVLKGSSTGIPAMTAGASALAPMGRAGWPQDLAAFKEAHGYEPADIHIGYNSFTHDGHKSPPALYVNAKNPLAGLTIEQVAQVFTSGAAKGDITHWGQLGLSGDWAKHTIHLYGLRDDGTLATTIRLSQLGKNPFSDRYEAFDHVADVVKAVAEDPYGIALAGFFEAAKVPKAKVVPLAYKDGAAFVTPSYDAIKAGQYPLASYLRLYVDRAPGKPLDPFVAEYARMVLSREGQEIIAAGRDSEQGFVPLEASAATSELEKLR